MEERKQHNYEYSVDIQSETASAKVIRMVGKGKNVLELGAGPGSITKVLKNSSGCDVTAVEVDKSAIEILSRCCDKIYELNLNLVGWSAAVSTKQKFDVVVIADVLEHLVDPHAVLVEIKNLLSDDGYIVVSLPHVGNNAIVANILNADFEYRNCGLLDKTHVRFFCVKNMQKLFEEAGYSIMDAEFVIVPPAMTEFASVWASIPSKIRSSLSYNIYGEVYQVVVKASLKKNVSDGVNLLELSVPKYRPTLMSRLEMIGKKYLSQKTRRFIRKYFINN